MAFRTEKAVGALMAAALALPAAGQEFRYQARHDHLRKSGAGTLLLDAQGISFQETGKKKNKHTWRWALQDIQQLEIAPRSLRVLTYKDSKWKLGADRGYRFDLPPSQSFRDAYEFLKGRLDQRFVAALADGGVTPLWRIPVKHLLRFGGSEGELVVGADRIVYSTDSKNDARTWRYADIENVSSTGPFQLTLTTWERALAHYGNLKGYNFQLKEPLAEARYTELWQRVNGTKGLKFLSYTERNTDQ